MRAFCVYKRNFMLGMVAARTDREAAKLAVERYKDLNVRLERSKMYKYQSWLKNTQPSQHQG